MTGFGYQDGRADQLAALAELTRTLPQRLARRELPRPESRVLLAGIGASHAALASPLYHLRAGGIDAMRTDCSDFPATAPVPALVLAVSQSGRSAETTELITRLGAAGAHTLAITNAEQSPLREAARDCLALGARRDSRVSTVGFVLTYAALAMLTELLTTGAVDARWTGLADRIAHAVTEATPTIAEFGTAIADAGSVDVVAAAESLSTCEETALLLREGPLVPAAAYGTRGYLHGPADSASTRTAHLLIGGDRELRLAGQLASAGTRVLTVTESAAEPNGGWAVQVPTGLTAPQRALAEICVLQELVSVLAHERGVPIDDPVFRQDDTKIAG
ncbi:SIS domain-containing protein [Sciscionella marina]|uniref:SIS domain-containing protein n=1 Tax=Sciscionella marina TaxID=508770 RepID=UPI00036B04C2|nr:SIS domain-containing protein [Sciscionella marina]